MLMAMIVGMFLAFSLAPLGFPFLYAFNLCLENEAISWKDYVELVYGYEGKVTSRRGKQQGHQ
jgi:hypothetical protein